MYPLTNTPQFSYPPASGNHDSIHCFYKFGFFRFHIEVLSYNIRLCPAYVTKHKTPSMERRQDSLFLVIWVPEVKAIFHQRRERHSSREQHVQSEGHFALKDWRTAGIVMVGRGRKLQRPWVAETKEKVVSGQSAQDLMLRLFTWNALLSNGKPQEVFKYQNDQMKFAFEKNQWGG